MLWCFRREVGLSELLGRGLRVLDGVATRQFTDLMRFEASRARAYYQEPQPLLGMVHARSRSSLWALIEIYSRLLTKIEASNYDVISRRIALSTLEKSWIVVQAALR